MFKIFMITIKRNFAKSPIILSVIVFSLIQIFILGNAIGGLQEKGVIIKEKVCYVNDLTGISGETFENFILNGMLNDTFITTKIDSKVIGEKAFQSGKYQTMIYASSVNGRNQIELYTVNERTPLRSLLNAFVESSNLAEVIIMNGGDYQVAPQNNNIFDRVIDQVGIPIGIDYYSVQNLLQVLVIGGIFGVFSVLEDYQKNVYVRINTAPIDRWKVLGGRILANILFLMFMALVIIITSIIAYDANWSGNIGIIALVLFLQSAIIVGTGMLLATITKSTGASVGLLSMILILWSKASGAFDPSDSNSITAYLSPNYNAKNALFGTIYGGSSALIVNSILIMIVIMVAIYAMFYLIDRRKINGYF